MFQILKQNEHCVAAKVIEGIVKELKKETKSIRKKLVVSGFKKTNHIPPASTSLLE